MLTRQTVQDIRDLQKKSVRDVTQTFIAEGPKAVSEFLDSSLTPTAIYATVGWIEANLSRLGKDYTFPVMEVGERDLQRISGLKTPNQVLTVFQKPSIVACAYDDQKNLSLALDEIQDPGNIGTIIRCADWFGIKHIFCSPGCADAYAPKVVQATMGSLARTTLINTDLSQLLDQHPDAVVYAAVLEGTSVYAVQGASAGIVLIGNESRGLSPHLLERANHKITIPRFGQAESLNAGVATGIILSWLTAPGNQ